MTAEMLDAGYYSKHHRRENGTDYPANKNYFHNVQFLKSSINVFFLGYSNV